MTHAAVLATSLALAASTGFAQEKNESKGKPAAATSQATAGGDQGKAKETMTSDKKQADTKSGDKEKSKDKSVEAPPAYAPIVVLVPVAVANTDQFAGGCWARLYDSTDFKGNQLSLVGPVDMKDMTGHFGIDWAGTFDSVAVGPKATMTVFDAENYQEKSATFKAGQKVADLDEKMGLFENIESVKVSCTKES